MFSFLKGKGYTIRKRGMIANRQLSNNDNYHANLKKTTIGHRRNNPYRKVSNLLTQMEIIKTKGNHSFVTINNKI